MRASKYGLKVSFNKLIDEERSFVFERDGKVVFVDAHEVEYTDLEVLPFSKEKQDEE